MENLEPWTWDTKSVITSTLFENPIGVLQRAYFEESIASFSLYSKQNRHTPIKFVNTCMHGVGYPFVKAAFEAYGFQPFISVEEQQSPDPDCKSSCLMSAERQLMVLIVPTVPFPNPEEKGALVNQLQAKSYLSKKLTK